MNSTENIGFREEPELHQAIFEADLNKVISLLSHGTDPNNPNKYLQTPIELAVGKENSAIISKLIEAGADVNLGLIPPLYKAVLKRNMHVVHILIDAGADLECEAEHGITPLIQAMTDKDLAMVQLLIHAGADIENPHYSGISILEIAKKVSSKEIVDFISNLRGNYSG